jgi:hypothetical protein
MKQSEERAIGCLQVLGITALLLFAFLLIYEPFKLLLTWMRY